MYTKVQIHERNIIMADEKTIINVDLSMFGQDANAKTAAANKASATRPSLRSRISSAPSPPIMLGIYRSWAM